MKINPSIFLNPINKIKSAASKPCLCGTGLKHDVFESSLKSVKLGDKTVKGSFVKDITLDDRKGNKVPGCILKNNDEYYACSDNEAHCRMKLIDSEGCMIVSELYGENNEGKYKGAGTELIKYAVEQSREKGYNGVLKLFMAGSTPFYYKNNFRLTEESSDDYIQNNAAWEYATRYNEPCRKILGRPCNAPLVVLDKKGADALMQGRRLFEETKSQKLYDITLNLPCETLDVTADFCDFGEEFAIQLVTKDTALGGQIACLTGKNDGGNLIPDPIDDRFDDYLDEPGVQEALFDALDYTRKNIYGK